MVRKTIIMLSAKRCGSTATFTMFQKHPDVGVCHVNPNISNWEPNFWNLAAQALQGHPNKLVARLKESHPFIDLPRNFTEDSLFRIWDTILDKVGPTVFDKSPQYLGDEPAFDLLEKYIQKGNDVRFFAFIRDARDAITSQYEQWGKLVEGDSPARRESLWLQKYRHLERLQTDFADIPLFRYEDFASAPACYAPIIFRHLDIDVIPKTYEHIRPTSIGRYSACLLPSIAWKWRITDEMLMHLKKYGYSVPQFSRLATIGIRARMALPNIRRLLASARGAIAP